MVLLTFTIFKWELKMFVLPTLSEFSHRVSILIKMYYSLQKVWNWKCV